MSVAINKETDSQSRYAGRHVLYVERAWSARHAYVEYQIVLDGLRARYDVEAAFDLCERILDIMRQAQDVRPFDAIVTHVPNSRGGYSYGDSFSILHEMKNEFNIPIVAYTGATGLAVLSMDSYVHEIVPKSKNAKQDLEAIIRAFEHAWDYLENPGPIDPPVLKQSNGWTVVDATVNLVYGLGVTLAAAICKKCTMSDLEVTLKRLDKPDSSEIISGKDLMGIMCLEAYEGSSVRISVEGTSNEAKELAVWLYEAITTRYICDMVWGPDTKNGED